MKPRKSFQYHKPVMAWFELLRLFGARSTLKHFYPMSRYERFSLDALLVLSKKGYTNEEKTRLLQAQATCKS